MRHTLVLLAAIGLAAVSLGCVTAKLTPEAEAIRITTLGEVKGKSSMWSRGGMLGGTGPSEEDARRRIRLAAVEMGANVVLVESSQTSSGGSQQRGEAYKCSPTLR